MQLGLFYVDLLVCSIHVYIVAFVCVILHQTDKEEHTGKVGSFLLNSACGLTGLSSLRDFCSSRPRRLAMDLSSSINRQR